MGYLQCTTDYRFWIKHFHDNLKHRVWHTRTRYNIDLNPYQKINIIKQDNNKFKDTNFDLWGKNDR